MTTVTPANHIANMNPPSTTVQLRHCRIPSRGAELFMRSVLPADGAPVQARLAIVHGYGDHSGRYEPFLQYLAQRGIAGHAVDLRGQGQSSGRRGHVRKWEDYLDDLSAFLSRAELHGPGPLFLLAHSHGALVVSSAVLNGLTGIAGCVMSSPYFHSLLVQPRFKVLLGRLIEPWMGWLPLPTGVHANWMSGDPAMIAESEADPLVVSTATPRWYFGHLRAQQRVLARAGEFHLPLLVLAGQADPLADPAAAEDFYRRAGSADKTFIAYPGFRHELLRDTQRQKVFADIYSWMNRRMN
jgi:alpha-beta hydrolase superfamily lysophospholipase